MSLIIVSQSGIVARALEKSASNFFDSVRSVTKIENIEALGPDTRAILYDFTDAKNDVEALRNFEHKFGDLLEKVVLLTREGLDFGDINHFLGNVGAVLPHTVSAEEIILIAQSLRSGLFTLPTKMLTMLRSSDSDHAAIVSTDSLELTHRQKAVLSMLAQGQSNKLIARSLGISDTTVRVHVRAVLRKLGVNNRTQAALVAARYLNA
jgi:two-component system, NarL family, nitrate/nitrite response regulator NarL